MKIPELSEKRCASCGKIFIPTRPEYAWGRCCSYSCLLRKQRGKKAIKGKPVEQFTLDGRYLASFDNPVEAAQAVGLHKADNIRSCCAGKTKTSAGFIWRYKEEKGND